MQATRIPISSSRRMDSRLTELRKSRGDEDVEKRRGAQFDVWGSIQTLNKEDDSIATAPYIHPLVRASKNSMSQRSLEICTESLGSETGSDGFSHLEDYFSSSSSTSADHGYEREVEVEKKEEEGHYYNNGRFNRKELAAVNYHCSVGGRSMPRSFPPPLPSISRRDGPCMQMRRHRQDGRLVLEAVPVPSQNYLHWQREGGRLVLSFIETTFEEIYPSNMQTSPAEMEYVHQQVEFCEQEEEEAHVEDIVGCNGNNDDKEEVEVDEEGEEVEVVDRGIVVEVTLTSRQPLPQSMKLKGHRPSLVINKFVGSAPPFCINWIENKDASLDKEPELHMATQSIVSTFGFGDRGQHGSNQPHQDHKLLLSFKKLMNRQALLHQVRRCTYQHGPLFIWEPCCIASS